MKPQVCVQVGGWQWYLEGSAALDGEGLEIAHQSQRLRVADVTGEEAEWVKS